jgi:hypothetical protein
VVLQWCTSGVPVVSQWCYSGVTVVSQWCCSCVAAVLSTPLLHGAPQHAVLESNGYGVGACVSE